MCLYFALYFLPAQRKTNLVITVLDFPCLYHRWNDYRMWPLTLVKLTGISWRKRQAIKTPNFSCNHSEDPHYGWLNRDINQKFWLYATRNPKYWGNLGREKEKRRGPQRMIRWGCSRSWFQRIHLWIAGPVLFHGITHPVTTRSWSWSRL